MTCSPTSLFVFPDPLMGGRRSFYDVTSEAGPLAPRAVPDPDNSGDLLPEISGEPTGYVSPDLELLVLGSGSLEEAEWVYRESGGTWFGAEDPRRLWRSHSPWNIAAGYADVQDVAVAWSPSIRRLIMSTVDNAAGEFIFRYQTMGAPYDTWTEYTLDPATIGAPSLDNSGATVQVQRHTMTCTASGVLLLAYSWFRANNANPYVITDYGTALLHSTDGGVSWALLYEDLGKPSSFGGAMKLTTSGSWVRLDWAIQDEVSIATLYSRASSDDGLSWSDRVANYDVQMDPDVGAYLTLRPDPLPFDVVGLGGGMFLAAYRYGLITRQRWHTAASQGDSAWAPVSQTVLGYREEPAEIRGLLLARSWDRIYALVSYEDGAGSSTDDQIALYYHPITGVFDHGPEQAGGAPEAGEWQPVEPLARQRGARFTPLRGAMVHAGDHLFAAFNLYDATDDDERVAKCTVRMGGTSPRSFGNVPPGGDIASLDTPLGSAAEHVLYDVWWAAWTGRPAGGVTGAGGATSADSTWAEVTAGAPVVDYTPDRIRAVTSVGDAVAWRHTLASSTADSWAVNGSTFSATCKVTSGSSQAALLHGAEVISYSTVAGQNVRFELRADTAGITLRDANLGADVATVAIALTSWTDVRVAFHDDGSAVNGVLVATHQSPYAAPVAASFTLTRSAGTLSDRVTFGAPGLGVGDSQWREVGVSEYCTRDLAWASPDSMLGFPTSLQQVPLNVEDLAVTWGGVSAAMGDSYSTEPRYQHPVQNALTDAANIQWRSGGSDPLVAQEVVLVADPDNDAARLLTDAVILDGIEDHEVQIDWDDDPAFPAPYTEVFSGDVFPNIVFDAIDGNVVTYTVPAGTRAPVEGELAGLRLKLIVVTPFPKPGTREFTFVITRHYGNQIALDEATDLSAPPYAILPTEAVSLVVFTPYLYGRLATPQRRQYMRITFADESTATSDHRLGAVIAGCALDVPIPLEWTHRDATESDVQIYEGANVSWAFTRGTDRRIWTARVVNDWQQWRESLRYLARSLASFEARPIGVLRDIAEHRTLLRGRYSQKALENSFWWTEPSGTSAGDYRYPGGDAQIELLEVP